MLSGKVGEGIRCSPTCPTLAVGVSWQLSRHGTLIDSHRNASPTTSGGQRRDSPSPRQRHRSLISSTRLTTRVWSFNSVNYFLQSIFLSTMASRPELKVLTLQLQFLILLTTFQLDDEGGFIRFFKSLPVVDGETIRIFDRGDWYTSHGEDANFIAKTVRACCSWPRVSLV